MEVDLKLGWSEPSPIIRVLGLRNYRLRESQVFGPLPTDEVLGNR